MWMFDGYKMTAFTDEEEDKSEPGKIGMPWYLEAALRIVARSSTAVMPPGYRDTDTRRARSPFRLSD
jgi:hypothetical protein